MFLGETIRAPNAGSATYFSPWFPRQGTKAVFACHVIAAAQVDTFTILVQTKRVEDDNRNDSIEEVGGVATISTTTPDSVIHFERGNTLDGSDGSSTFGFRDLVRFTYILTSDETRGWLHFRMLDPTWETD